MIRSGLKVIFCILFIILALGIIVGFNIGNIKNTNSNNGSSSTSESIIQSLSNSITQSTSNSVVTKENYEKIKNGMSEADVQSILGEPQSISENEISGFGKTVLKHYQEGFTLKGIDVYFSNGKVYMKNWTEL